MTKPKAGQGTASPAAPDADAVLTREEVAAWLKVRPRQIERLGIPHLALGHKTVRYLRTDVIQWIERQRRAA